MALTLIFLISCIITARLLEKKKMRVASVAYSVTFILLLFILLFVTDIEPISRALANMLGANAYGEIKLALIEALRSASYGTCITIAILLTFFLQLAVTVFCAVSTIVRFFKKWSVTYRSKREKFRIIYPIRNIYIRKPINLLYCRMLN